MDPRIGIAEFSQLNSPVVLDVRWSLTGPERRGDYLSSHLPGAVFLDLDADLCGPVAETGGRHPLPDPERLREVLRGAGISDDSTVVVYDDDAGMPAARAWWTLRWAGIAGATVLEGGFEAWRVAGMPVESGPVTPEPGTAMVRPGSLPTLSYEDIPAWLEEHELIDVRAPERYRGENEPIDPVAGHIPGAANIPVTRTEDIESAEDAAFYCGSGVTASLAAWRQAVAGLPVPPVYVGSWSDWISRGGERAVGEGK
ncbi:sulfurtransferase [Salininema proteolyticum]|uniref:Sulfurtransferase n=1 Tax=Salininema proteolyticum TaxID=1607685 RepID=A0ABV8U0P6_9ACTN